MVRRTRRYGAREYPSHPCRRLDRGAVTQFSMDGSDSPLKSQQALMLLGHVATDAIGHIIVDAKLPTRDRRPTRCPNYACRGTLLVDRRSWSTKTNCSFPTFEVELPTVSIRSVLPFSRTERMAGSWW